MSIIDVALASAAVITLTGVVITVTDKINKKRRCEEQERISSLVGPPQDAVGTPDPDWYKPRK